jgi:hypothetical protein
VAEKALAERTSTRWAIGVRPRKESRESDPDPVGNSPIKLNKGGRRGWRLANTKDDGMKCLSVSSNYLATIKREILFDRAGTFGRLADPLRITMLIAWSV